ncbi:FecR family protein [Parapedobacter sp. 10938]|uniref:FecR family protein n=1 Tax=Parapedobacter flavus TaxID=3110225 RepID=UPI002DB7004E|nr:FecR domain-containing protein [Parapedobacter sp. 10938]MEC3880585.1 FecR domain-containing protein [Parapedobacter sp. 10938]
MDIPNHIELLAVKYLNGTISRVEYQELTAWVDLSAANRRAFDQLREIWLAANADQRVRFDSEAAFERFERAISEPSYALPSRVRPKSIALSYRWAAAVVIFALLTGIAFYYVGQVGIYTEATVSYQEIIVPNGSRSKIRLPDSSLITVNAGTTVRYNTDFGEAHRNIWLDGEAYFVVEKSQMPFIVHSGTVQIKAVGTEFNVRAYSSEGQVETTLISGKVLVRDTSGLSDLPEEVALLPNQKLIVAKRDVSPDDEEAFAASTVGGTSQVSKPARNIIKQEHIDPAPNVSWKDEEWVIYRESLGDLSVKLERRYNVQIIFVDNHLKSFRYNGTLPDEPLEQVLKMMSMVSPIRYTVTGKTVVFSEK